MPTTNKIRIIKRDERALPHDQTEVAGEPVTVGQKQEAPSRDAVSTITGWIKDLRQKKDLELVIARAFKNSLTQIA